MIFFDILMLKGCCKVGLHYFYVRQFYETCLEYFPFDSTSLNLKLNVILIFVRKSMFVFKKLHSSPLTQPGCSANHIQYFCFIQNLYNQLLKYFTSVEFQGSFSYCLYIYYICFTRKDSWSLLLFSQQGLASYRAWELPKTTTGHWAIPLELFLVE